MIPPNDPHKQAPTAPHCDGRTTAPPDALALWPAPDPAGGPAPACCPTCGRVYDLFHPHTSVALDCLLVAREALTTATEALSTLTHALEEDLP